MANMKIFDNIQDLYSSFNENGEERSVLDSSDINKQVEAMMKTATQQQRAAAMEIAKNSQKENLKAITGLKNLEKKAESLGFKLGYQYDEKTKTVEIKFYDVDKFKNGDRTSLNKQTKIKLSLESGYTVASGNRIATDTYAPLMSKEGIYLTNSWTRTISDIDKGLNQLKKAKSDAKSFDRKLRKTLEESENKKIAESFASAYDEAEYQESRKNVSKASHMRTLGTIDMSMLNKQLALKSKAYNDGMKELRKKHIDNVTNQTKLLEEVVMKINLLQEAQRNLTKEQATQIAKDNGLLEEDFQMVWNNLGQIRDIGSNIGELSEKAIVKNKTTFGSSVNSMSILPNPIRDNKHIKQVLNGLRKKIQKGASYRLIQKGDENSSKYNNYNITKTLQASPQEIKAARKQATEEYEKAVLKQYKNNWYNKHKGQKMSKKIEDRIKYAAERKVAEDFGNLDISEDMTLVDDGVAGDLTSVRRRGSKVDLDAFKKMLIDPGARGKGGKHVVDNVLRNMFGDNYDKTKRAETINGLTKTQIAKVLKDQSVQRYLARKSFGTNSLENIKFSKGGQDGGALGIQGLVNAFEGGEEVYLTADEVIGMGRGQERKVVDALSERRSTAKASNIVQYIGKYILQNRGLNDKQINETLNNGKIGMIEIAKKTKVSDVPALIERAISTAVSNGKTREDFIKAAENAKFDPKIIEAIGKWIVGVDDEGRMIFNNGDDDVKNIKYEHLAEILVNLGIFERDKDGYKVAKNVLLDSSLNLANVWDTSNSVKVSDKEYNAFQNQIARVTNKTNREELQKFYEKRFMGNKGKQAAENRAKLFDQSRIKTYSSRGLTLDDIKSKGNVITIGSGKGYTIDTNSLKKLESKYKNGKISEDEYNNSIYGEIESAKKKLAQESGLREEDIEIVYDAGGNFGFSNPFNPEEEFSGRFVYIPSTGAREVENSDGTKSYLPQEYHQEFMSMLTANKNKKGEAIQNFEQKVYNEANQKDGELYENAHSVRMSNSKGFHAVGINPGDVLDEKNELINDEYADNHIAGVYASRNAIANLLRFDESKISKEDYEAAMLQYLKEAGYDDDTIQALFGASQSEGNYNGVISAIINHMAESGEGLSAILNRFPTISRMGVDTTKIFLDKNMTDDENLRIGIGLWKLFNGDFDGDTAHLMLSMHTNYEQKEALDEMYKNTIKKSRDMAQMSVIADYIDAEKQPQSTVGIDALKLLNDPNYVQLIGIASKNANKEIGTFSNYATRIRNEISDKKLKTLSDINENSSDADIAEAIRVRLTEMFGQSFEQDVISSKKLSEKYTQLMTDQSMTDEEREKAKAALITQYMNFDKGMHEGGFTIDQMMENAKQFGIVKDGAIASQPTMLALAEIRNVISKEKAEQLGFGWLYGDSAMKKGSIDINEISKAMKETEYSLGTSLYENVDQYHRSAATSRKNLPQNYGDAYQLTKSLKEAGVESFQLGETIQDTYSQIGSVINQAAQAVDAERASEQAKIGVANQEAKAIGNLADKYTDLWQVLQAIAKEKGKNSYKDLTNEELASGLKNHGTGFGDKVNSITDERNEMIVSPYNQQFVGHAMSETAKARFSGKTIGGTGSKTIAQAWKNVSKEDRGMLGVRTAKQLQAIAEGEVVYAKGHLFNIVQLMELLAPYAAQDGTDLRMKQNETPEDYLNRLENYTNQIANGSQNQAFRDKLNEFWDTSITDFHGQHTDLRSSFNKMRANEKQFGAFSKTTASGILQSASSMFDLIGGRFANAESEKKISGLGASHKFVSTSADLVGDLANGYQYAITDLKVHNGDPKMQDWLQVAEEMKFLNELVKLYSTNSDHPEQLQKELLTKRFGKDEAEKIISKGEIYSNDQLKKFAELREKAKEKTGNYDNWLTGNLFVGNSRGGAAEYSMSLANALRYVENIGKAVDQRGMAITESQAKELAGIPGQIVAYNGDWGSESTKSESRTKTRVQHQKKEVDLAKEYNDLLLKRIQLQTELDKIEARKRNDLSEAGDTQDRDLIQRQIDDIEDKIKENTGKREKFLNRSYYNPKTREKITSEAQKKLINDVNEIVEENNLRNQKKTDIIKEYENDIKKRRDDQLLRQYSSILRSRNSIDSRKDLLSGKYNLSQSGRERKAISAELNALEDQIKNDPDFGQEALDAVLSNMEKANIDKTKIAKIKEKFELALTESKAKNAVQLKGRGNIFDSISERIMESTRRFFEFGAAARILQAIPKYFRKIIETAKQLDEAMTNIRVVTGYNREQAESLMKSYNGLAKQLGTTTQAIAQSANQWLRQGYSVAEVNDLITASTYLSKLGQIDAGQATQYLTSTLKGFKLEAREAVDVVSVLTKLDQNFAVSASGVAEALSKTAVSAQLAGVSLEQIAAMVTTVGDVSQASMDSVGTAFKTLFARYGNVKAGVFEDITDSSEDSTKALNDIEKVLGALGIRVRSSAMEFRDFDDVLDELANRWTTLSNVEKNAVATALGGARQREQVNILLENYQKYKDALDQAENSEGTAEEKYGAVEESVAYKLNEIKAAWEELVQTFNTNPIFTLMADGAKVLMTTLKHLLPLMSGIFTVVKGPNLFSGIKEFTKGSFIGKGFDRFKAGWNNATEDKAVEENTAAVEQQTQATEQQVEATKEQTQATQANTQAETGDENSGSSGTNGVVPNARGAKLVAGRAIGGSIIGGVTAAATSDWSGEDKSKAIANTIAGASSGLMALGPYGMIAAAILQVGNFLFQKFYKSEEEKRQERVEQAQRELSALDGLKGAIDKSAETISKAVSERTADDYKALRDAYDDIYENIYTKDKNGNVTGYSDAYNNFVNMLGDTGFSTAMQEILIGGKNAQDYINKFRVATQQSYTEQLYASQEDERYNLLKKQRKTGDIDVWQSANQKLKTLDDAILDSKILEAFYKSSIYSANTVTIKNSSLEDVIKEIAKGLGDSAFVGDQVEAGVYSKIYATLHAEDRYKSLFTKEGLTYGEMTNKEDMRNLAHTLGLTAEKAENLKDAISGLSSDWVINGVSGLVEKFEDLKNVMSDLSDGSLSYSNLTKIIGNYGFLLNGSNGISTENIAKNISSMFNGLMNGGNTAASIALNKVIYDQVYGDNNIYDRLKQTLKDSNKGLEEEINAATNLNEAIASGAVLNEGAKRLLRESGEVIAEEIYTAYRNTLLEYENHQIDEEISGLQSVKDSLKNINDERKKELELIKAKQAIENAKDEKSFVYRAGIGWTYETNSEAIKQAQDNYDQLQTELQQDNIQYQIDQLNTQKDILSAIKDSPKWEELKKIYDGNTESLFGTLDPEKLKGVIYDALNNYDPKDSKQEAAEDKKEKIQKALDNTNELKQAYDDETDVFIKAEKARAYNRALDQFNSVAEYTLSDEEIKLLGDSGKELANNLNKIRQNGSISTNVYSNVAVRNKGNNAVFQERIDAQNALNFTNTDTAYSVSDINKQFGKTKNLRVQERVKGENGEYWWEEVTRDQGDRFAGKNINQILEASKSADLRDKVFVVSNDDLNDYVGYILDGFLYMPQGAKDGGLQDERYLKTDSKSLYNYAVNIAKVFGGKIDSVGKMKEAIDYLKNTLGISNETKQSAEELYSYYSAKKNDIVSGAEYKLKKEMDTYDTYDDYRNATYKNRPFAHGTFNSPVIGGSLINELGTEAIVTPYGTITALPSHSGVVPADLTENLYKLGEISPMLIKELTSRIMNDSYGRTINGDDNSMNIGTINATFNTSSDFDVDKFLVDLRQVASNTNRR